MIKSLLKTFSDNGPVKSSITVTKFLSNSKINNKFNSY